jgi:sensor histidine kinase YesM
MKFFGVFKVIFFLFLLSLCTTSVQAIPSDVINSTKIELPAINDNQFENIMIRRIKNNETANSIQCHQSIVDERLWQAIEFKNIPQNQHFCLRASININRGSLAKDPALLVGMLGSVKLKWDASNLITNGQVGVSFSEERPGQIKTLVRIPDNGLTDGLHRLTAEISTFHVGKELNSIGYVLALVDEQKLGTTILFVSMLSALFVGILFILFVIFQLIHWRYQAEYFYQMFSVLCLSAAMLLTIEQMKFWLDYPYHWHIFRLSSILVLTFLTSFLLPMFYIAYYRLTRLRLWGSCIVVSLLSLSFIQLSFDSTSILLFFGALIWSLAINFYQIIKYGRGKTIAFLMLSGLVFVVTYPEYFIEFGFGLFFIVIVITMLVTLIGEMRTHKELSLKAERIKTELLRRNIQPHFLMNSLTQLMELIETSPKAALHFISALSEEFRQLTLQSHKDYVPLADEIMLCNNHLQIMSLRYQKNYHLTVVGEVDTIVVPSLVLHCLVENCFTHNKISSDRLFQLEIITKGQQVELTLTTPVENKVNHQGTGTGEQYIRAKLAELNQQQTHFVSFEAEDCWISKIAYPNTTADI